MEIREKRLVDEVVGIVCDICGQPCFNDADPNREGTSEYATLRAEWGYWSDKDGSVHECHMCEACYDKVRRFIEHELKGKVRVTEYWPFSRPSASEK
jgi:hypothetical protein